MNLKADNMNHNPLFSSRYAVSIALTIFCGLCVWGGRATLGSSASDPPNDAERTTDSAGDVEMASAAMGRGDLHLAMNHLTRRLDRAPGDGEALTLLVNCVRRWANDANDRGDHVAATGLVERLRQRVYAARQARFASSTPVTSLNDVTRAEEVVESLSASITGSADAQARLHIEAAMRLADGAYHHLWWNDRDQIREALRQLRWVCERGQAVSKDTTGRYFEAMNRLKEMVVNSEWDNLLTEAGYVK